jgi:WD40 repeat protein/predicted Ser/Thr protein kinase
MSEATQSVCPTCGASLSRSSIGGVCMQCLGRLALGGPQAIEPGRRLESIGDYELLEEIARGGMGVVYRARDRRLKRLVAIKLLLRGDLADADARRRFELEAEAAAALQHPGIVTVFEVGESAGEHFIAMELIEGASLDEALRNGPMSPERAARCLHAIAEAVAYAHGRRVLHRDLKPSNILLDANGRPRITDFGMARLADSNASLTLAGRTFGSPNYMPPEQADPFHGPATPASDVFSLGAVLYHALTGRPPFVAETLAGTLRQVLESTPIPPRRLHPKIPADLETICLKCLEKQPSHRYASAQELADDLARFLRGEPVTARPVSGVARAWRWARRHPALASVSVGLFLALTAIAIITSITSVRVAHSQREAEQRAEESRRNLIHSLVVTGNRYLASDDAQRALPWFLQARELEKDFAERRVHETRLATTLRYVPELTRVWSLDRRVEWLDLSPDGSRVICADGSPRVHVWPIGSDDPNDLVIERGGPIFFATFSPDGRRILTSGERQSMLMDAAGNRIGEPFAHVLHFRGVSQRLFPVFSADGKKLLTATTNRVVLRSSEDARAISRTLSFPATVKAIALFPDGHRCAVATDDKRISIIDAVTGERAGPELQTIEPVRVLALNSTATRLAGISGGNRINVWDLNDTNSAPLEFLHANFTYQCDFVLNDRGILTTSYENSARLWDAASGKLLHVLRHDGGVYRGLQINTNGLVVFGSWDGTARVWDLNRGLPAAQPHIVHGGPVLALAVDRARNHILTGSWDGTVRLHELAAGLPTSLERPAITTPAAFPRFVALGIRTTNAALADPFSGKRIGPSLPHTRGIQAFGIATNAEIFATLIRDGRVTLWNARNGEKHRELTNTLARDIELTPDGKRLLAIQTNGLVRLFDTSTERGIEASSNSLPPIRSLVLSADSRNVAMLGLDGCVRIASTDDGQLLSGPFGPRNGAALIVWSPDGSSVAVASGGVTSLGSSEQSVQLWNVKSGKDTGPVFQHRDDIRAIAFSSDGEWLATGSEDYDAKVWNRRTGQVIGQPLRHSGWVVVLAFSPDGKILATGSSDGFLRLWQLPNGEPIGPAMRTLTEPRFLAFDAACESLVIGFANRCLRWDLALPANARANLAEYVTLASGMRLSPEGVLQPLAGAELVQLWTKRQHAKAGEIALRKVP